MTLQARALAVAAFAVIGLSCSKVSYGEDWTKEEWQQIAKKCEQRSRAGSRWDCRVISSTDGALLFDEPSDEGNMASIFPIWETLIFDPDTAGGEWIKVRPDKQTKFSTGGWKWVKRGDVSFDRDARRIVGCWPIQEMKIGVGDTVNLYRFKTNGSGRMEIDGEDWGVVQLYMLGDGSAYPAVSFGYASVWVRYDPMKKMVFGEEYRRLNGDRFEETGNGETIEDVKKFPDKKMGECKEVLLEKPR